METNTLSNLSDDSLGRQVNSKWYKVMHLSMFSPKRVGGGEYPGD